jgi:hypothetical protein
LGYHFIIALHARPLQCNMQCGSAIHSGNGILCPGILGTHFFEATDKNTYTRNKVGVDAFIHVFFLVTDKR